MHITTRMRFGAGLLAVFALAGCDGDSPTEVFETSPNFSIALNSTQMSALPGENVLVTLTLTRTEGFTGPVSLTAERLPGGVTMEPDLIEGDELTGRVTLRVPLTAGAGTSRPTIRAASPGAGAHVVPFTLTIRSPTSK